MKTFCAALALALAAFPAVAQTVKITPVAGAYFSGAHAMNELVRPASVIITYPNEPVTEGGKLRPLSRTAEVIDQLKATPHLAISGRTMEFDGKGKCVAGC